MERIYKAAAPIGVEIIIKNIAESIALLNEAPIHGENFLILVKTPDIIERLLDNGISISKVVLGGMGAKTGRKTFNRNVSASEEEVESFRRIIDRGTEIVYQLVPNDKAVNISKIL